MDTKPPIDFGDHVRVLAAPETEAAGVAGRVGQVYGFTRPSVSGVAGTIGGLEGDFAFLVRFDDRDEWIHPRLLEFADHAIGSTMTVGGRTLLSTPAGWVEQPPKPWWKFW